MNSVASAYLLLDDASFRLENLIYLQTAFDFGVAGVLTSLTFVLPQPDPILAEKQKQDFVNLAHVQNQVLADLL